MKSAIIQPLEGRVLFAFSILADGVLRVTGTDGNDAIRVFVDQQTGDVSVTFNGQTTAHTVVPETVMRVEVLAGAGDDEIDCTGVDWGADALILGADGNDTVRGGLGDDTISGGSGNDLLLGNGGADKIAALDGDDSLSGGDQGDTLDGGAGNDRLDGHGGRDKLVGGAGADRLFGGNGDDYLDGGSSNDRLEGGTGVDIMLGQGGDDRFFAADNAEGDRLYGGSGIDNAVMLEVGDFFASVELASQQATPLRIYRPHDSIELANMPLIGNRTESNQYTAHIDWGDGRERRGSVAIRDGRVIVSGTSSYPVGGTYNVTLTVAVTNGETTRTHVTSVSSTGLSSSVPRLVRDDVMELEWNGVTIEARAGEWIVALSEPLPQKRQVYPGWEQDNPGVNSFWQILFPEEKQVLDATGLQYEFGGWLFGGDGFVLKVAVPTTHAQLHAALKDLPGYFSVGPNGIATFHTDATTEN